MMTAIDPDELTARRRKALRTALVLAAVAVTVFVAFLLTGVVGGR